MNFSSSKRGSALLVVMGLLGFMMVSAIAFSAYMRYSRLPSSYLRRTSASRQLVKAALAAAIDDIDKAINKNPHPNIGAEIASGEENNRNLWKNRVFIGKTEFLEQTDTVPVLTLEALAYIPPSLINEARYYSRITPTARWKQFSFDAGRYAYCALDVSDYFDLNRLTADFPRSSRENGRISLSYLFENYNHQKVGTGMTEWDTWMETFRDYDEGEMTFDYTSKIPLISTADFNLALGNRGKIGEFFSPFYDYVTGQGNKFDTFGGKPEEYKINSMSFVTDSLVGEKDLKAVGNSGGQNKQVSNLYLDDIFPSSLLNGTPSSPACRSLNDIIGVSTTGYKELFKKMPLLSLAAFYDYLDPDRVPVSLAIPTLERSPMLCALRPEFDGAKLSVRPPQTEGKPCVDENCTTPFDFRVAPAPGTDPVVYQKMKYSLSAQDLTQLARGVKTLFVYPFAHKDEISDQFKVNAKLSFFFTEYNEEDFLRTGVASKENKLLLESNFDKAQDCVSMHEGVASFTFTKPLSFTISGNKIQEEDRIKDTINLETQKLLNLFGARFASSPMLTITYSWKPTYVKDPNTGIGTYRFTTVEAAQADVATSACEMKNAVCGFPPLKKDGRVHDSYTDSQKLVQKLQSKPTLKMHFAIWAQVVDDKLGKTVDLVPAHFNDDNTFNNVKNNMPPISALANDICGKAGPLMRFDTGVNIVLDPEAWEAVNGDVTKNTFNITPKGVMVDDPRYNYAPEFWHSISGEGLSGDLKGYWIDYNQSESRNGDIFMATSDQGYVQSIHEFNFVPHLMNQRFRIDNESTLSGKAAFTGTGFKTPNGVKLDNSGTSGGALNSELMWKSYRTYATRRFNEIDEIADLGFKNRTEGYKINPYSDSTNIIMAAFANTPLDWRMASTNNLEVALEEMTASQFNSKYAWNEYTTGDGNFKWEDLEGIAGRFMGLFCNRQYTTYDMPPQDQPLTGENKSLSTQEFVDRVWEDLWFLSDDDEPSFGGYKLKGTSLWSVDKKFLYGYWRDSFDARQQLFLIFVRSEPLMLGGGALNKVPPQLGARAVALVWRDPLTTSTSSDGYPHKTRILFYKQLD